MIVHMAGGMGALCGTKFPKSTRRDIGKVTCRSCLNKLVSQGKQALEALGAL